MATETVELYRGDDIPITIDNVYGIDGQEVTDLSDWKFFATIKEEFDEDDTDANAVAKLDPENFADQAGVVVGVLVTAGLSLVANKEYYYDLQAVDPNGYVKTLDAKILKFSNDVTRRIA